MAVKLTFDVYIRYIVMMTRRACDLDTQLKLTLQELQTTKATCQQLLQEREDSEAEMGKIFLTQKKLRKELTEMHIELVSVTSDRARLQQAVSEYQQERDTHEDLLRHVDSLQNDLKSARELIQTLQNEISSMKSMETQTLFDELVCAAPNLVPVVQGDTTLDASDRSKQKRQIKKLPKSLKQHKKPMFTTPKPTKNISVLKNNVCLKKERQELIDELNKCKLELDKNIKLYNKDTQHLQLEICRLKESLSETTNKYQAAQQDIQEYANSLEQLLELGKQNYERFESLSNSANANNCSCQETCLRLLSATSPAPAPPPPARSSPPASPAPSSPPASPARPAPARQTGSRASTSGATDNISPSLTLTGRKPALKKKPVCLNIVMYSDEIGKGFGSILCQYLNQNVTNNCFPGASYSKVINKIKNTSFPKNTVLIVLIGRRGDANKKAMINHFTVLNNLNNVTKVILFALPFVTDFKKPENDHRHFLNVNLHTLTCRNDEKFHFIDINKLSSIYCLTKDMYYLSMYFKRQIVQSLSYFINNTANLSATPPYAFIEKNCLVSNLN